MCPEKIWVFIVETNSYHADPSHVEAKGEAPLDTYTLSGGIPNIQTCHDMSRLCHIPIPTCPDMSKCQISIYNLQLSCVAVEMDGLMIM